VEQREGQRDLIKIELLRSIAKAELGITVQPIGSLNTY
jgi:hypothetical protein